MIHFIRSRATGHIRLIQTVDIAKNRYKLTKRYGEFDVVGMLDKDAWEMERVQLVFAGARVDEQHTGREWFYATDELMEYIAQHAPLISPSVPQSAAETSAPSHSPQVNVALSTETKQILEQLALAKQKQEGSHRVFISDIIRDALQEYLDKRGIDVNVEIKRAGFYFTKRGRHYAQKRKK